MATLFDEVIASIVSLSPEETNVFRKFFQYKSLSRGSLFAEKGKVCIDLGFVQKGYLRNYHFHDGDEVTTEFSRPGTFCSSFYSFLGQQPSYEFVECITDVEMLVIGYDDLQSLYETNLQINILGRRFLEQACLYREERVKNMITMSAQERYEWFTGECPGLFQYAPLQYIASYLGMKPETISRIRRRMIS